MPEARTTSRLNSKQTFLIGYGEAENVMVHFCENASFGSHDKPLLVCRGLLTTYEKPTMNSEYEFIVATPAVFIDRGGLEKFMRPFHENANFNVGTAVPRPAPTLPTRPQFQPGDGSVTDINALSQVKKDWVNALH